MHSSPGCIHPNTRVERPGWSALSRGTDGGAPTFRIGPGASERAGIHHPRTALEALLRPYPTLGGLTAAQSFRVEFRGRRVMRLELAGRDVDEVELEPPVLASYYGSSRVERRPVDLEKLPRELVLAVLAAEDAAFFEHAGISPTGVMRAAVGTVARDAGAVEAGYRFLANNGSDAHQEVPHFHVHVFAGRDLGGMIKRAP